MAANFGSIYKFQTKNGVVIPDTSEVKTTIEGAMKTIFGEDLDVTAETPMGRLVEALTLLMVDVVGVNAQNANNFNPSVSVGAYLDNIGAIFGIDRLLGESDDAYRKRIVQSQSRGNGFAESVRQAIARINGVTSVCVLENGYDYPRMLPSGSNGVAVPPHSMFVCVGGWDESAAGIALKNSIAGAIIATKSAGCGFCTTTEYGTPATVQVEDEDTGSVNTAIFYKPTVKNISIEVTVDGSGYVGDDIVGDTSKAIVNLFTSRLSNSSTTKQHVISAIASANSGIVCTNVVFKMAGVPIAGDTLVIKPYEATSVYYNDATTPATTNITVTAV